MPVKQLTTHNNALTVGQQCLPTAEGMLLHMEWSEGVACGVINSCYFGLGVIFNLQNILLNLYTHTKPTDMHNLIASLAQILTFKKPLYWVPL